MNTTQANALRCRLDAAIEELAPLIADVETTNRSWDLGPSEPPSDVERAARDRVARCRQHVLPISRRDANSARNALEAALEDGGATWHLASNPASIVQQIEDLAQSVREMRIY